MKKTNPVFLYRAFFQRMKGVVVRVSRNSKVVYDKAFGGMDDGKPIQKGAIFRICSKGG
jgi:hypothetical protein